MTTINPTPEHRQELRALLAKLRARAIPIMAGAGLHTYQVNSEPDPLCAKTADAISALLDHIERLEAENAALKRRLSMHEQAKSQISPFATGAM